MPSFGMSNPQGPRAWLLLAAGADRGYGGNLGYHDEADSFYSWDSTVQNSGHVAVGDCIAVWDKYRVLGISVIEEIERTNGSKILFSCPKCGKSTIKPRKHASPRFKCKCGLEFDEPATRIEQVTQFRSRHDAAWTPLGGEFPLQRLRELSGLRSQLSMRSLDWIGFCQELMLVGNTSALRRVGMRSGADVVDLRHLEIEWAVAQGHARRLVRVRRGQTEFRKKLLERFGHSQCAFTGPAPERVLEAGHLYSYAQLGEHRAHGGLLLRRDIHRLFDDGWLAVDPKTQRIDASAELRKFSPYADLHRRDLTAEIGEEESQWLAEHWREHRHDVQT